MTSRSLRTSVDEHLRHLVEDVGARPPGSPANARATTYVRDVLGRSGLPVTELPFQTVWWEPGPGRLVAPGLQVDVEPNPYSPAVDLRAPAVLAASREDVLSSECRGRVLVLSGPPVAQQVTPTGYPFYRVEEHVLLVEALVAACPAAVVAVSDHWAPVFEDPRLPFPSTTVRTEVGARIAEGNEVHLVLRGRVHSGEGGNVSASTVGDGPRVVLSGHLDSKVTTPGALDNAGSVAAVLAAVEHGELLRRPVEVVLFNGEDHVDACGELAWLAANDLASITAAVNLDGAGAVGRATEVSTLGCPPEVESAVRSWVSARPGWLVGEPWYESDHAVFAMRGVPAVAVTSADVHDLLETIVHTSRDTLETVDADLLVDVAQALPGLVDAVLP